MLQNVKFVVHNPAVRGPMLNAVGEGAPHVHAGRRTALSLAGTQLRSEKLIEGLLFPVLPKPQLVLHTADNTPGTARRLPWSDTSSTASRALRARSNHVLWQMGVHIRSRSACGYPVSSAPTNAES